jgi:phage terminase small subunit
MMNTNKNALLTVVTGTTVVPSAVVNDSEIPRPQKVLTDAQKSVWNYIAKALKQHGLIHKTDVMVLHVIVSTFCRWIDAEKRVDDLIAEKGTYIVTTTNGYEQPHQMFYVAQKLKRELLQWLPEACLTIPSFSKVKQAKGGDIGQGDLFADNLGQFVASKPRLVHSR